MLTDIACTSTCSVIDRLEIGLIILDDEQRVLHWNRWFATRCNQPAELAKGQTLESIFPEITNSRLNVAIQHAIKDGLPSLLSPALHGTLLPLYQTAADRRQEKRMQQMIHVLPLGDQSSKSSCIVQISDMTANISRERLLRQQAENLRRSNNEDTLTRLPNRRKFDEVLASEFHKAQSGQLPVAVAIADIDHFSDYNAMYGRESGDKALADVAAIFRSAIRPLADLVGRYGGEEFAFVLPGMSEEEACCFAENLRLRVVAQGITNESSAIAKVLTVSIGITVMVPDESADTHTLISSADVALYQAKHEGRNQTVYFSIEDGSFRRCA